MTGREFEYDSDDYGSDEFEYAQELTEEARKQNERLCRRRCGMPSQSTPISMSLPDFRRDKRSIRRGTGRL